MYDVMMRGYDQVEPTDDDQTEKNDRAKDRRATFFSHLLTINQNSHHRRHDAHFFVLHIIMHPSLFALETQNSQKNGLTMEDG